ncbi:MAG: ABC transporter permease [Bacteroidetes bacterium RIFOXYA12_FULL_35_11]|nr:MAG: ABC transporter permease [Bacteroidetes bacterium GWF2_35_48]OFY75806.1 MAG: ABC transporter permease [Bacteroidetes bacterium RIFOXYA12_FULL_35_11]OFY94233.1 MAG: ABC transporter permease [Bacteroidetes bacterium RIFOXYB2_FULL_35_7]OFY98868.1 MAG: ABC transporter permease [Bacteroidetes bacterium RIFOXYC12_FULL_35_7]HBX53400.1 ABC transporter permease [Bacteroidales bacterium]
MGFFFHIGRYFSLLIRVFARPEKFGVFIRQTFKEIDDIGIQSLGIISIISIFMGAEVVIQAALSTDSPLIPKYLIGFTARQSIVLEFSSSFMCLILAGKVGSRIASEIGTMRISEQIDALETMGVNSASYLIQPKIVAALFIFPFLTILSMVIGLGGGYLAGVLGGLTAPSDYIYGLQIQFRVYDIIYALIKVEFFAFIIASVSSYYGYYAYGGSLEVGRASTKAVVMSSILILFISYLLTQILLT